MSSKHRSKGTTALASVCLACIVLVVCAQSRYTFGSAQLLTQGRFDGKYDMTGLAELPLLFSWPASSVHTSFTGDSISATLSSLPATATYDVSSRFAFRVDEELKGEETTTIGHTVIRWHATGLGSGDHPVRQQKPAYFSTVFSLPTCCQALTC